MRKRSLRTFAASTLAASSAAALGVTALGSLTSAAGASPSSGSVWQALANCESGGNYATDTGNGYYGAYQFSAATWHSLGYAGLPSQASPAVQDQAAARLQARSGWDQWPACSAQLGLSSYGTPAPPAGASSSAPATNGTTRAGAETASVATAAPAAVPDPAGATGTYVVQPGDYLAALAQRFGTTVSWLAGANHIVDPDLIYAGQTLTV
ncbi:MAG: transglycosylase family protein [Acidimicrobiales bacterium]